MQTFLELVKTAVSSGANEVFLVAGQPIMLKDSISYRMLDDTILTPHETAQYITQAYEMMKRPVSLLDKNRDDQFAMSLPGISRIRITSYFQRNSYAMTARIIPFRIPSPGSLHIPANVMALSGLTEGLILICGPSGSGKTTTAACFIDAINQSRCCHILTLESPIEYLFRNQNSFISQRELYLDTADLSSGIQSSRWLSPDVLYTSDFKEGRSLAELLEKADSGCLVIGSVNAGNPASALLSTINRFPAEERPQSALLLSQVLRAVVFQKLLPGPDGSIPEFSLIEPDNYLREAIKSENTEEIRSILS